MGEMVLRTEKGGYEKKDVLSKIDAYNTLILAIDEMRLSDAAVNAELEKIRNMPMRKAKGLIFAGSGFSAEDTDNYIKELEETIMHKIML
ncbi:MAG: hypothetical protein K6B38_09775 [Ruminococcus sp.]|nr:hypothetical protein [Ruminococcus sp.]